MYRYITASSKAAAAVATLARESLLGIDIETTGLDPYTSKIRLVQVATQAGQVSIFDMQRLPAAVLAPLFDVPLAAHNASFEYSFFKHAGLPVAKLHDTMLLGRLTQHERLSLAKLAKAVLALELDKTEQVLDWAGELSHNQLEYAALDAVAAVRLTERLLPQVHKAGQHSLYRTWCAALPVLTKTAAAVAGVLPAAVTSEQRTAAKAINFGTLYGQGPSGLARTAQLQYGVAISRTEAKQALNRFTAAYPQLAHWQRLQVATARMYGQVKTRLGLIRDFNVQGVGYLEGESQNIPVQGSAAEVLLSTLARLPVALEGIDARLYHNVHDEVVLDVAEADADRAARALQAAMVDGFLNCSRKATR